MRPFPRGQPLGPYYRFAAVLLWPAMMALTRQDWRGSDHLGRPGDGIVVAPNHISWFDPIVLAHFLNDNDRVPRFLAKEVLFHVPFVGLIVGGAGQIPVYRETDNAADAVRSAVTAVAAGEAVVVYPEGTLTRDPELWPMTGKTGAARIALLSGRPVVPIAHWGAQEVMGPYAKEFHAFPPKTMRVVAGPPVDLDDLRGLEPTGEVLTEATSRIMDAITGLLATLRSESPPQGRWNPKSGSREVVRHPLPRDREGTHAMARNSAKSAADTAKKAVATQVAAAKKTVAERRSAAEKSVAKATDSARKRVATQVSAARKVVAQATPSGKKTVAKRATGATAAAKETAAPAKKTAATAKATATKTATKKAPAAKRAPAAKTTAKKAPAKKATATKAPAKKAPAKKATATKTTAKKTPAKKTPAKKAAASRRG